MAEVIIIDWETNNPGKLTDEYIWPLREYPGLKSKLNSEGFQEPRDYRYSPSKNKHGGHRAKMSATFDSSNRSRVQEILSGDHDYKGSTEFQRAKQKDADRWKVTGKKKDYDL